MRRVSLNKVYTPDKTVPVSYGGTDADNLIDAARNLELTTYSLFNVPNGVLALDANKKAPLANLPTNIKTVPDTINGSIKVAAGQVSEYEITNYDTNRSYTLSLVPGSTGATISRTGNIITYTAPSVTGTFGFIINDRTISLTIIPLVVSQPTVIWPVNNATGLGINLKFQSSAFSPSDAIDKHVSSNWEIATDSGFTTIVFSSINDKVNLTEKVFKNLSLNTTYYVRVKHRSSINGYSSWSTTKTFTTNTATVISIEEFILSTPDMITDDIVGYSTAITSDGSRIAIAGPGVHVSGDPKSRGGGAIYIYRLEADAYVLEYKYVDPNGFSSTFLGKNVIFSASGDRCVVSQPNYGISGVSGAGRVIVLSRSGTTWTTEGIFNATDFSATSNFGYSVSTDDLCSRIVVGAPKQADATTYGSGVVYVFSRSGTTWTQEQRIVAADKNFSNFFGTSVDISGDGLRLIIGSPGRDSSAVRNSGGAYIYLRSGTVWNAEATLSASDRVIGDLFGTSVAISQSGTRVIVGSNRAKVAGASYSGAAYTFNRSGVTWAQQNKLTPSDVLAGAQFGSCVDMDNTGNKVVIGAPYKTVGTYGGAGCAYVLKYNGTAWIEEAKLTASDGVSNDTFGFCVSISATANKVLIGAPQKDSNYVINSGGAYIYS